MEESSRIQNLRVLMCGHKLIITHDTDFSTLLAVGGYNKPSVINLRLENATPDFVTRRIIDVVAKLGKELEQGIVVSVDEVYARYRELPIKAE
jgi:predicted nuclease of predicted toxin-antitoxin system